MEDKPIEICFAHSIRRADRVLSQIYNDHLSPLGLRITQFSLMRALHYMGETTASHLEKALVMDQTTVSRGLKPLVRDGYIAVKPGDNRREKKLALSPEGEALYQQALEPWELAQQAVKVSLGDAGIDTLIATNREIVKLKK